MKLAFWLVGNWSSELPTNQIACFICLLSHCLSKINFMQYSIFLSQKEFVPLLVYRYIMYIRKRVWPLCYSTFKTLLGFNFSRIYIYYFERYSISICIVQLQCSIDTFGVSLLFIPRCMRSEAIRSSGFVSNLAFSIN